MTSQALPLPAGRLELEHSELNTDFIDRLYLVYIELYFNRNDHKGLRKERKRL